MTVNDSLISGCSAVSGGGGFYLWHSYGEAFRTLFVNNTSIEGGGLQAEGGVASTPCRAGTIGCALSSALVEDCTFDGNRADNDGGAALCRGAVTLAVHRSAFLRNVAGARGGAVHFSSPAEVLTVLDSTFESNQAGLGGGAVTVTGASSVTLGNSTLDSNLALLGDGGGVEVIDAPATTLCVMGATQTALGTKGAIAVTGGGGMPSETDFVCTWQVTPETILQYEDCVVEARRAARAVTPNVCVAFSWTAMPLRCLLLHIR